ncbi:hypothetical protein K456DRAFT_262343 [Colletotrichum gloeosporioides 23]|nr:hypothetical protein K456DRAFT_262343 [Colletotrichum gloeosporioides 23]
MNDRLPSLSSEPAGQHHAHPRLPELASVPSNAAPVSPTAIQGGPVIPDYEHQFAFAHQQPDASVGLDAGFDVDFDVDFDTDFGVDFDADIAANSEANFDIDIDIDVSALTIGDANATGVDDLPPFWGDTAVRLILTRGHGILWGPHHCAFSRTVTLARVFPTNNCYHRAPQLLAKLRRLSSTPAASAVE